MPFQIISDTLTVINGLKVPVGNLGLSRKAMPQIDDDKVEQFIEALQDEGVNITEETVNAAELRLVQAEINKRKVWAMLRLLRGKKAMRRAFITRDDYVLDGSHRFVAKLNKGRRTKLNVYRVDMNALPLIRLLNSDPRRFGIRHRSLSGADLDG